MINSSGTASSKKRSADHLSTHSPDKLPKTPKLFPIFNKPGQASEQSQGSFKWLRALGDKRTCLHGVNLEPQSRTKIAAFDLDGCIIESELKKKKGTPPSFTWWRASIPAKLKEVHEAGYSVVIISNQALRSAALEDWKKKIPLIGAALPEVPFRILAATARDGFRKPIPGMWYELERIFREDDVSIDKEASFFVGDAAGRPSDHASTDRKWALNVGLSFWTPEEYFLKLPAAPFKLPGFHVSSLPANLPSVTPTSTPIVPTSPSGPEIILFVGLPAQGKTTFYRKHFDPAGYVHVNQDTLRTRDKCIHAVEEAIQARKSCVVDNTNRDAKTRKYYIDLAQDLRVPIRCFVFAGTLELAWHNNLYRAYNLPPSVAEKETKRELLPYNAFTSFCAQYEEPQLTEGFSEIMKVNWVFEGSEEERARWNMWLQIDGK